MVSSKTVSKAQNEDLCNKNDKNFWLGAEEDFLLSRINAIFDEYELTDRVDNRATQWRGFKKTRLVFRLLWATRYFLKPPDR